MKEILFYFYRTKLIGINMETNNLLAPLFFVLIGLMGGAILKFGLKNDASSLHGRAICLWIIDRYV